MIAKATTQAAVMTGANQPLKIERTPIPDIGPGQVLVQIACCTLCGSDLHTWTGRRPAPLPTILGHEAVGVIAELGAGRTEDWSGKPLAIGDRIVWTLHSACGKCDYCCERNLPMKCRSLRKFGHQRSDTPPYLTGGLAEHAVVEAGMAVFRVPESVPDPVAAPATCAGATAVAACEAGQLCERQSVLIVGAGALGVYAAAYANHLGCVSVLVADRSPDRLESIHQFGATATVLVDSTQPTDGRQDPVRSAVDEATGGEGVDCVIEVAGSPHAAAAALDYLRVGGRLVTCGCVFPNAVAPMDWSILTKNRLTITGLHNYHPEHLLKAIELLQATAGRFPWESLVEHTFPLDQTNQAIQAALNERAHRVAVTNVD